MKIKNTIAIICFCIVSTAIAQKTTGSVTATDLEKSKNDTRMVQVSGNTYMISGKGGNIAIHFGAEEILMIDDKFADDTDEILEQIGRVNKKKPISFLINTHHHGDHTGGNENMAKEGATIISHDNARANINYGTRTKETALPKVTFSKDMKLWFDGQEIYAFHVDKAHTNGDVMVYIPQTNVLHTGDAFVNGMYPYIDIENGGTLDGYIKGLSQATMVANKNTKIIPGHGKLANIVDVKLLVNMLEVLKKRVTVEISRSKTEEEVAVNTELTKEFDEKGFGDGFINGEKIRRTIYKQLTNPYENDEERLMDRKINMRQKAKDSKKG